MVRERGVGTVPDKLGVWLDYHPEKWNKFIDKAGVRDRGIPGTGVQQDGRRAPNIEYDNPGQSLTT